MTDTQNIIYILIGTGSKPLASYSPYTGEFIQNCEKHLADAKPNQSAALNCHDYLIFYLNEENITYLLMTGTTFPKTKAVACLESLKKELRNDLVGINFDRVSPYGLSENLKEKLEKKFDYFSQNIDISSEPLQKLKQGILEMNDAVNNARQDLIDRSEKMGQLQDKSEELKEASSSFRQGAIKVRKATSRRKVCIYIGVILSLLIIVYFIIVMACHSWTFKCKGD